MTEHRYFNFTSSAQVTPPSGEDGTSYNAEIPIQLPTDIIGDVSGQKMVVTKLSIPSSDVPAVYVPCTGIDGLQLNTEWYIGRIPLVAHRDQSGVNFSGGMSPPSTAFVRQVKFSPSKATSTRELEIALRDRDTFAKTYDDFCSMLNAALLSWRAGNNATAFVYASFESTVDGGLCFKLRGGREHSTGYLNVGGVYCRENYGDFVAGDIGAQIHIRNTFSIVMNASLMKVFKGVPFFKIPATLLPATFASISPDWYMLDSYNQPCAIEYIQRVGGLPTTPTRYDYITQTIHFPDFDFANLTPTSKMVLYSHDLPIRSEHHPINVGTYYMSDISFINTYPIIASFVPIFGNRRNRGGRMIVVKDDILTGYQLDILPGSGTFPRSFTLRVAWIDNNNVLRPLTIPRDECVSVQMCFVKF